MKIGFKPKKYDDVIYFNIDDKYEHRDQLINDILNTISASSENNLDLVVTVKSKSINADEGSI